VRRRAFDRLAEEARLVGADAVVGVRLSRGEHDWARGTIDYVVSGTAVRYPHQNAAGGLVLSDLSAQEYWKLRHAGWDPAGLVAAAAVFFVSQSTRAKWRRRSTVARNQELSEFSQAFSAAREQAIRYLRNQAFAVGASGIVGVRLEHRISGKRIKVAVPTVQPTGVGVSTIAIGGGYQAPIGKGERQGMLITIHAVGTAIRNEQCAPLNPLQTVMRLGA
jgi:uncharacterized protein YbjQ (UPF0145 family)